MDVPTALSVFGYTSITEVTHIGLKRRYKNKAKKLHPDKPGGSEELFIELRQAYVLLTSYENAPSSDLDLLRKTIIEEEIKLEKAELERRLQVIDKSELLDKLLAAEKLNQKHQDAIRKQSEFLSRARDLVQSMILEYQSKQDELEGELLNIVGQLEKDYKPTLAQKVLFFLPKPDLNDFLERKENLVSTFKTLKQDLEHDLSKEIVKMYGEALNKLTSTLAELEGDYESK